MKDAVNIKKVFYLKGNRLVALKGNFLKVHKKARRPSERHARAKSICPNKTRSKHLYLFKRDSKSS